MKVWSYFLDEFATNMAFIDLGASIHHEMLEQTVAEIGVQLFPQPPKRSCSD